MEYRAPRTVPSLDGLRFICLCAVVFGHLPMVADSGLYNALWHVNQNTKIGYLLVDTFFTLSGFLITRLLLAEKVSVGRISFGRFYARRGLRILPIYYLTLIGCIAVFHFSWAEIAALASYTFNIYHPLVPTPNAMEHTWSLSVEEQFYLAWPLLISALPLRFGTLVTGRIVPALGLIAAAIVTLSLPLSENELAGNLIYMLPVTRMVSLSLGAWIAFRELERRPVPDMWLGPMFVAAVCVLAMDKLGRSHGIIVSQGTYWTFSLIGYAMMSLSVVGALVFSRSRFVDLARTVLSWRAMRAGGRGTYGGYLYHLPILYYFGLNDAVVRGGQMSAGRVALAIGVMVVVTALSYRFVEKPLLKLKDRIPRIPSQPMRLELSSSVSMARSASLGVVPE